MRSSNPVLSREGSFSVPSQRGWMPSAPAAGMTIDDVVVRSATLFGVLVATGALAWVLNVSPGVGFIAGLGAFVVALVAIFKRAVSPALFLTYAALEGVFLGAITHMFESLYDGIAVQAMLGVVMVFGSMLFLYKSGRVRVTPKFTKVLLASALAFIGLALVNLLAGFFVDGGLGLRDGGPLAIGFSLVGIAIGAMFYALDFDQTERLVAMGAPKEEAWRAAFGLTLTTVWVYLEIIRLLSYFRE